MNKFEITKNATKHQKQMSSLHPHAIIGTIEDAIIEALSIANVSINEVSVCRCKSGHIESEIQSNKCIACLLPIRQTEC